MKNKDLLINNQVLYKIFIYIRPELSCSKMQLLWHLFAQRCRKSLYARQSYCESDG